MATKNKTFNNTWIVLLSITSILFFIVSIAMIFFYTRNYDGVQYLISTILFTIAIYRIYSGKFEVKLGSPYLEFFNMGFIFTVVGLNLNVWIWALGAVLFARGLYNKK